MKDDCNKLLKNKSINELDCLIRHQNSLLKKNLLFLKNAKDIQSKKIIGEKVNKIKEFILKIKIQKKNNNIKKKIASSIVFHPSKIFPAKLHPLSSAIYKILNVFLSMGFVFKPCKEVQTYESNFNSLNIHELHPLRKNSDTFYIDDKYLLRTHTTCFQKDNLSKIKNGEGIVTVGRVYRNDYYDSTHSPVFHQLDGIFMKNNVCMTDLLSCLHCFFKELLPFHEIRCRPSYFPFTEPSIEIDIKHHGKWVEVAGGGIIHNSIIKNQNSFVKRGFAFGIGIERIAMLMLSISDIRYLYKNDINFLRTFGSQLY